MEAPGSNNEAAWLFGELWRARDEVERLREALKHAAILTADGHWAYPKFATVEETQSGNPGPCGECNAVVDEVCPDYFCRACHVNCSFEDCVTKTYAAAVLLHGGHSEEYVRLLHPDADIERARTLKL